MTPARETRCRAPAPVGIVADVKNAPPSGGSTVALPVSVRDLLRQKL
ncbi:hypothetical protein [Streptomyces sp. NPDC014894]